MRKPNKMKYLIFLIFFVFIKLKYIEMRLYQVKK